MRIGIMCGMIVALLSVQVGVASPWVAWGFTCFGVLGGVALSSKLDAIARACDRD
jgi:hypothetical protein